MKLFSSPQDYKLTDFHKANIGQELSEEIEEALSTGDFKDFQELANRALSDFLRKYFEHKKRSS